MTSSAGGSWSLGLGRWCGVELRLHMHFPLLVLWALLLAAWSQHEALAIKISFADVTAAVFVLLASVTVHELVRMFVARRVGGHTSIIVIGPTGGWVRPTLPADPPAHLVTALAGPVVYLALAVAAACLLVVQGQKDVLPLLSPFSPEFEMSDTAFPILHQIAQLTVWINFCLLLINLIPVQPCDAADLLHGMLWPLVGRSSAATALSHIAYGAAAATMVLAILLRNEWIDDSLPAWFPLALLSVIFLYGGHRSARQRQYDVGLAIDELDSDDEQWLNAEWLEDDRAVVLVEHLQEKQQEALDRKKRERETQEDARVDDILARLNEVGFDQLSEEDQAILKRASRRYRERRSQDA